MSQPVGDQYGLELRRPELYEKKLPPIDSHSLVSNEDYRTGSQFSGVRGFIQPPPHVPTASERLSSVYAIDPTDDGSRPDSVLPPELDGNFDPR